MATKLEALVGGIITGRWRSQCLYVGVKLGLFDVMSTTKPKAIADIAKEAKVDRDMTYRLFRALASLDLLQEIPPINGSSRREQSRFQITEAGSLLQTNHPKSMAGMLLLEEGPEHYALWKHLPDMVTDGKQNAFIREYGQKGFDYAAENPDYDKAFNLAMTSYSRTTSESARNALRNHDFSKAQTVCDIGGGHGYNLCYFLQNNPLIQQGVVFDLPIVMENEERHLAKSMGVEDRCTYVGGDMFQNPSSIPKADIYFLKLIIHDWNDDECKQILDNVYQAASPGSRLFICDHVIPDPNTPSMAPFFDMHMACWGTGSERTESELHDLLVGSGWDYGGCFHPEGGRVMSAVEGIKK
jgi:hypothetical protein